MPCCFGAGGCSWYSSVSSSRWAVGIEKSGKGWEIDIFLEFRRGVRHFFGAILGPVRPSVPCCFGAGRCSCYFSVSSNNSNGCFGGPVWSSG